MRKRINLLWLPSFIPYPYSLHPHPYHNYITISCSYNIYSKTPILCQYLPFLLSPLYPLPSPPICLSPALVPWYQSLIPIPHCSHIHNSLNPIPAPWWQCPLPISPLLRRAPTIYSYPYPSPHTPISYSKSLYFCHSHCLHIVLL